MAHFLSLHKVFTKIPSSFCSYSLYAHVHLAVLRKAPACRVDDRGLHAQDGAIEALVAEKLRGRFLFVSANVVNHPLLSHVHARLGAVLPLQAPPPGGDDASAPWAIRDGLPPAANVLDATAAADSRCMWILPVVMHSQQHCCLPFTVHVPGCNVQQALRTPLCSMSMLLCAAEEVYGANSGTLAMPHMQVCRKRQVLVGGLALCGPGSPLLPAPLLAEQPVGV